MTFPDDLPGVVQYYQPPIAGVGKCDIVPERGGGSHQNWGTVRCTYPRRAVAFRGSSGTTDAASVCPRIPYGATHWRTLADRKWRPLSEIPASWLPFLQRERGSEMDPRAPPCPKCGRASAHEGQMCGQCQREQSEKEGAV